MKTRVQRFCCAGLFAALVWAGGYHSGRATAAAAAPTNFERDSAEMDRTTEMLVNRIRGMNDTLKKLAAEVTPELLTDKEKKRDRKIQDTLAPLLEDTQVLFIQTYMLAVDSAMDKGGADTQAAFAGHFAKKLEVPLNEFIGRQDKHELGVGGVLLGYAIAKAAKVAPDEIFTNKMDNKSWVEVMRARQVTVTQLQGVFSSIFGD